MDPAAAMAHAARRLGLAPTGAAPLPGGLLNHVFRVHHAAGSVVVKHAPPHVAANPEIALDPGRAGFEAAALRSQAGRLVAGVRAAQLFDEDGPTLILEDLGDPPDLAAWLAGGGDPGVVDRLGRWLRALHDAPAPAHLFNAPIQRVRLAVQYAAVGDWLAARGLPDAAALGARARELGARLCQPGPVLVQGDLWPASVLVRAPGDLRVIDWEFATRGQRCQDLGHLWAHLWMGARLDRWSPDLPARLLAAYGPLSPADARDSATHAACEALARTLGPFAGTGVLAGRMHAADAIADAALALFRTSSPPG